MIDCNIKLRCDGCKCWLNYEGVTLFDHGIWSYAQVRRFAKNIGWKRINGLDICDRCVDSKKKVMAARCPA